MDAIIAADHDGSILVFNPAAERLFGYTASEAIGRQVADLIMPPDIGRAHLTAINRHLSTGEVRIIGRRVESTACNKAGESFPVEIALSRDDSWATPIFTAVIRDIRERRGFEMALHEAREEAWAASHAKSEFIAILSHELRTPLSSIVTSAALLEAHGLDEEALELVRVQRDAGEALMSLTSNILDVSRIEEGYQKIDSVVFDPRATVLQALRIVSSRAQAAGVALVEAAEGEIPNLVVGDLNRWRQALLNLLTNALKFTQHGSVTVTLESADLSETSVIIRAVVTDTGIGMTQESLGRVFEPFEQADASVRSNFGGTGLGLHIVRRLVEIMGGTLSAGSTPGVGSSFAFSIPFSTDIESALNDAVGPRQEVLRILLVEDHEVNRRLVTKQLEAQGHHVIAVGTAADALQTIWLHLFDIVLMDVGLPDADGFVTTRKIIEQAAGRGWDAPPIVALTAGDAPEVRSAALAAGMTGFLTKPLRLAEWQSVVDKLQRARRDGGMVEASDASHAELAIEVLDELADSVGWDSVVEAAQMFADEMPHRVAAIATAVQDGVAPRVADESHALKGVAATLGASRLAAQCRNIEIAARQGQLPDAPALTQLNFSGFDAADRVVHYARMRAGE